MCMYMHVGTTCERIHDYVMLPACMRFIMHVYVCMHACKVYIFVSFACAYSWTFCMRSSAHFNALHTKDTNKFMTCMDEYT
jgi:hypothetical protein